jgi:hypothetical protein
MYMAMVHPSGGGRTANGLWATSDGRGAALSAARTVGISMTSFPQFFVNEFRR